jgi:hypothetical protein
MNDKEKLNMAEDQNIPAPTREHERLKEYVGRWRVECTYFQNPNHPPIEVSATETVEMLGEFWALSRFVAEMDGFTLEGTSTLGFDPHRKKWVSTWIDNSSPALFQFEGEIGGSPNTRELTGSGPSPFSGEEARFRSVETVLDSGERRFEMYITLETGDEMQMFTYLYSREE